MRPDYRISGNGLTSEHDEVIERDGAYSSHMEHQSRQANRPADMMSHAVEPRLRKITFHLGREMGRDRCCVRRERLAIVRDPGGDNGRRNANEGAHQYIAGPANRVPRVDVRGQDGKNPKPGEYERGEADMPQTQRQPGRAEHAADVGYPPRCRKF